MATISGRVVFDVNRSATIDGSDTGLQNIPVVLQDTSTGRRLTVLTDANGDYSFLNVPDGNYRIVEAYGETGGVATPGDFNTSVVGPVPTGEDPPISFATNPPAGATDIDSVSPNTLLVTVAGADLTDQNFLDGPVIYTPIGNILDSCTTVIPGNLVTAADNGTFGTFPAGTAVETGAPVEPYPGVTTGFSYILPNPPATRPVDGSYTVQNTMSNMTINNTNTWWRISDHTTGDETGRYMAIGGSNPGAPFFEETINVTPNTNYLFSSWILNLIRPQGLADPALGVEILDENGGVLYSQTLGSAIPANQNAPEWKEIGTAFNSGNNNQITVRFLSEGPAAAGNDFAIDDIQLQELDVPEFIPIKSVSPAFADIGDTVTYTITLTNTCSNDLTNVSFQDNIPQGLSFVNGSVTINGASNGGLNPETGFNVGDIPGNSTTTITFDAMVDSIPTPDNPTPNVATMDYSYAPIDGGISTNYTQNSNVAYVQVNNADLTSPGNFNKSSDKDFVAVGDTITYTIDVTNTGNVNANNVVITDPIPPGTSLVPGSVSSNVLFTTSPPDLTVNLTSQIAPNETVTVMFDVLVESIPNPNPIQNTATIDYTYTVDPNNPDGQTDSGSTNTTLTQVNSAILDVNKVANTQTALVGDNITYIITVTNNGNVDATNVILTDIIPSGTTYVSNSLVVDGISNPSDPNSGIDISPVAPNQTKTISFNVLVNENPSPLPLENTANVDFEYLVDPNGNPVTDSSSSNTVEVDVSDIEIIKSVDPEYVQLGEASTFSTTITNTGNVNLLNIIFTDPPPIGTNFVSGSVFINGVSYPLLNPNNPINIGVSVLSLVPLQPSDSITINYDVTVDTLPQNSVITNISSAQFEYLNGSVNETATEDSNEADLTVREGEVVLTKTANKTIVAVGDNLTYTITAQNTGNISVNNVILNDLIPPNTSFVDGSVVIGGVSMPSENPNSGINLGTINAQSSVVVSFTVSVDSLPQNGEISNTASSTYEVLVDPNGPPITEESESNEVITEVELAELTLIKSCSPHEVNVGDEITYSFTLINNGTVDATNIIFFDTLPTGVVFVENSFVGSNQSSVVAQDLIDGVDLGNLDTSQRKNFSFRVTLESGNCNFSTSNTANVTFEYELIAGETLSKGAESNICVVDIICGNFKQTFKDGNLTLPEDMPDIESISSLTVSAQVTNIDTITSPIGKSKEGQILTGVKQLICIEFIITLVYTSSDQSQPDNTATFTVSSCEFLVTSSENIDCGLTPNIVTEDIYYEMINERKVFYNITYLINACP